MGTDKRDELSPDEITRWMNDGIRRALATPPTPTKKLVGKTERAKIQRESLEIRKGKPGKKAD